MTDDQQALCDAVGQAIVARDLAAVHALFAPWLQTALTPDAIGAQLDAQMAGLAHPPASWSADEGLAELADLRTPDGYSPPTTGLPREITDANFRGWLSIQFRPDDAVEDEQNVCYDVWIAPVEPDGGLQIGYFEAAEAS
jgi:hypothetical protein